MLFRSDAPLLSMVSLLSPALAMGNTVVLVPSERYPLVATDFYQVLDTSDVPAGAINFVTGSKDLLARVLAEHDDVDAVWYVGHADLAEVIGQRWAGGFAFHLLEGIVLQGHVDLLESSLAHRHSMHRQAV